MIIAMEQDGRGHAERVGVDDDQAKTASSTAGSPPRHDAIRGSHGVVRGHVVAAAGILRDRLAKRWTLDALAEEVHLSRSQLARSFDATVGTSPMAFLRKMREERMARLPATTDLSVAEAGRSVGWRDPNYASATFHDYHGVSPTEYRRRHASPPIG